ncbi:glycosyltransferase [Chitinophaga polysaccharea]|uniref:glycosyltransferase n=1 Tax=Chitinophaga polysaccharea TaxID=1293035 RepID=UPI0014553171|nr:glycosyltransferase [Chitinophaga polysaccharea]NLR61842.1 glycosyltransferase [Chitinophaga polysaccharea]
MDLSNEFSVLMTVYHKDSPIFFTTALRSIIDQTLPPKEIVLVADGPLTPELNAVIADFQNDSPSLFNFISLPKNMGMGYAMDTGLKACKFEYVARMDADDIAKSDRFFKQMEYLTAHPETDIVGANIEEFAHEPGDLKRFRKVAVEHNDIVEFAKSRCPFNHMTVMYKRSKVLNAGSYWSKRIFEDYHLWYQMIRAGYRCHNLPEPLVFARVGNNMVGRRRGLSYFLMEKDFFKLMKSDEFITAPQYYKSLSIRMLTRILPLKVTELIYKTLLR